MYILTGTGSSMGVILIWVVVLVAFMFFFMIRPQRREKQRKEDMMSKMSVGDTVCTTSGFYGTLIDVEDDVVIVEFGNNRNCRIPMQRSAIAQVEKSEEAIES